MENRSIANCDALLFLERLENSAATLIYFDPPAGASSDECDYDQLSSLYLYSACHAKRILRDSGVLVWHAIPECASDVRRHLDRVFGPQLFATEIVLKRRLGPRVTSAPTIDHTSLIVYSKTGEFHYEPPTRPVPETKRRLYSQSDSKGPYKLADITTSVNRPNLQFPWHNHTPPAGRAWRYSLSKLEELRAEGRIISDLNFPREKVYLSDHPREEIGSVWDDIDLPPAERVPGRSIGQQSLSLMNRVISMLTQMEEVVVDPFCGTGTTLVASQQQGRSWLGADCSSTACTQAVHRLKELAGYDCKLLKQDDVQQLPPQCSHTELIRELPSAAETGPIDIYHLITSPESKTLEFKQTLSVDVRKNEKQKYIEIASLKTMAGFLNSDGGTLLVGVSDNQEPLGLEDEISRFHKGSTDKLLLHFKNLLRRYIGEEFYPLLDYRIVHFGGKSILRVDCKRSDQPCFIGDDFYVRINPATDKLTGPTMLQYVSTRFPNYGT